MAIDIVNIALQDEIGHLTNRDMNKAEMLNASFASVFNILVFSILWEDVPWWLNCGEP